MSDKYDWPDDIPDTFTARYQGSAGVLEKGKIYSFKRVSAREWSCCNERNCSREVDSYYLRKYWEPVSCSTKLTKGAGKKILSLAEIEAREILTSPAFKQEYECNFVDDNSHITDAMAYALMNKIKPENEETKMRYTIQQNVTLVEGRMIADLTASQLEDMATNLVSDIESAKSKQEAVGEAKNSTTTYYGRMIKELKEQLKIVVAELNSREV